MFKRRLCPEVHCTQAEAVVSAQLPEGYYYRWQKLTADNL